MPSLTIKNNFASIKIAPPSYVQKLKSHQISRYLYVGVSDSKRVDYKIDLLTKRCLHELDNSNRYHSDLD